MGALTSINPATGVACGRWQTHSPEEAHRLVDDAHEAFRQWRGSDWAHRSELLHAVADQLDARREELASLMTLEMGKPVGEALAEVDKCSWTARFYADQAPGFLADRIVETPARRSWVSYEPVGVVL
ncbi:MAG: aldehyde dehydrogenase family protein, partial [Actinobacteria bacterium]|nr:aldehyde dehydrogenase family protein [Actinomycetota bacterium]